jgi:hypothetical protein
MRQDLRDPQLPSKEAASVPTKNGTARRKRIVLAQSMSVTEAFVAVTRGCIGHIATAVDTTRRSDDRKAFISFASASAACVLHSL